MKRFFPSKRLLQERQALAPCPDPKTGVNYTHSMLSQEFLAKMKARLLEEKARLERDLGDIGQRDPKHPNHFDLKYPEFGGNSDDDNAAEVTNFADEISIGAKLESELRDVTKALDAIENGTYGICKYCEKDIDVKRLEARPTSSTCIACKKTLTQEM
jgi:RNA polymerase-binding transcription factor DksA